MTSYIQNIVTYGCQDVEPQVEMVIFWENDPSTGIYPSSFTNVHFWKKIEFSNIILREKQSQNYSTM